jgi:transposase
MRQTPPVELTEGDRLLLESWTRSRTLPARQVERARILLLAAAGESDLSIGRRLGFGRHKARRWRRRFLAGGVKALEKEVERPGRPRRVDAQRIVTLTTQTAPPNATDWSTRLMAKASGASEATVRRVWHKHGLKPHRTRSFKLSNDPLFAEKLEDIVGLYLSPPAHAIVLCVDEKSQIQALERTQPGLPLRRGRVRTMTHDYKRHGTTTLFAALNILDGTIMGRCAPRHRHQEWLAFLKELDASTPPDKTLHLILDNYATHKHAKVKAWLAKHPRLVLHFTPTSASWLNMVERFFRDLTVRRVRSEIFPSLESLIHAIHDYLHQHNQNPKPFIWKAKACDILAKVTRARATLSKVRN